MALKPLLCTRNNVSGCNITAVYARNLQERHPFPFAYLGGIAKNKRRVQSFPIILSVSIHTPISFHRSSRRYFTSSNAVNSSYGCRVIQSQLLLPCYHSTYARHVSSYQSESNNYEPQHQLSTLADLEYRVNELERARLTKHDLINQAWPLLSELCAQSLPNIHHLSANDSKRKISISMQKERLERTKLSCKIIELCLKEVEARRVFLWEWLEKLEDDDGTTINSTTAKFSPTSYWNETPHPTKEMYTLVLTSFKHVIELFTSYSIKSVDAMEVMESAAIQSSALLSLMEDEYSSDAAFINAYNSKVSKGRYTSLIVGAALPDVRNYNEVIGTWGKCIDGSVLRLPTRRTQGRRSYDRHPDDSAFQKRLQLEATAMKSMMKLLESMENDLYETFSDEVSSTTNAATPTHRRRPPPDRYCYNNILLSMARQINPSLYEMRLVLQRMMERVKYEMEQYENDDNTDENEAERHFHELATTFFPDVFSYNALIEARAKRSAMFSSDTQQQRKKQQQNRQEYAAPSRLKHHSVWQHGQSANSERKRRFTSSEEEALLAEQTLDEMSHLVTVSVRPNIYSYNAVIKAWIKTDSERGLQRAVMILRALALNGHLDRRGQHDEAHDSHVHTKCEAVNNVSNLTEVPSVFERIARWGASLLGTDRASENTRNEGHRSGSPHHAETTTTSRNNLQSGQARSRPASPHNRHNSQNQPPQQFLTGVGMASRLNYIHSVTTEPKGGNRVSKKSKSQPKRSSSPVSIGMSGRIAVMNSIVQSTDKGHDNRVTSSSNPPIQDEPIGQMPNIEANAIPDIVSFQLVIKALEHRGTLTSAQLASDLLLMLEECYFDLKPGINIYNSTLNAWTKAAKEAPDNDLRTRIMAAQGAEKLLLRLLKEDRESGMFPPLNEASYLAVMNVWANVATAAVLTGNISDGRVAAQHADDLLKKLRKQQLQMSKLTLACFGSVIRTLASVDEAERAQAVLEDMIEITEGLQLDPIHFNAVFDAWARKLATTKEPEEIIPKLSSVHGILLKMDSRGSYESYNVDADTSSFNHVIRACYAPWSSSKVAEDDEKIRHEALDISYDCYTKMTQDFNRKHKPDAHTYSHMFKAIACLLPSTNINPETQSERYKLCKTILGNCCEEGYLTKSSLWILRKMFSADEFAELLLSEMDNYSMNKEKLLSIPEDQLHSLLPKQWKRRGRQDASLNSHRQSN